MRLATRGFLETGAVFRLTICSNCGHVVQTRAPLGEGTQAAKHKKKLNLNELAIGQILSTSDKSLTIRQVQGILYERGIKRQRRREQVPSGGWNYHEIQLVVSMLLGAGLAKMTKTKEFWDEQGPGAIPTPRYFMEPKQAETFQEIFLRQGEIKLCLQSRPSICPKCGAIIR
jgi:hypothetical protein